MKVFVELTEPAPPRRAAKDLRDAVTRLVDVGATGVSVSDHLLPRAGTSRPSARCRAAIR